MKRFIITAIACILCWFASAQSAFRLHYWFDTQHENGITAVSDNGSWQTLLETDGLTTGFHTLYTQVQDSSGRWFMPKSFYFYKTTTQETADLSEYIVWFDQDVNPTHRGVLANGTLLLDTDSLPTGFHTVNIQFGSDSKASLKSYMFYKQPAQQVVPELSEYIVWFDEDSTHTYRGSLSNGTMLIDVDSLRSGFHTFNIQFGSGSSATLKSFLFYKSATQPAANETMAYTMWVDQDIENKRTGTFRNEHLILDLGTISTGFHTLYMQFGEGSDATLKSTCFYRKPHAELQIVRYVYWINDLDLQRQVVELVPQDTVDLITLLPLEPQPIRTTNFLFNPNDGTPIVNAKNEIHFTFYNAQERSITRTFPYIDYNVVDTIYADTIERNTTRIVEVPSSNRIHWFKLSAGAGDSLSFRTDKPCIMQLFAPNGAEVLSVKGQNAITWKGCHSFESGTYYLAVHDVEDTGTIAVSYQWLYRYAVIAWDVHRVGNGGISSINFEGNGFNSLDTVYLYKGTDTIPAFFIGRESRTATSIAFNFENVDTGMYQALFKFEDEDIFKTEVVYVETAKPIVLTTTCSYPQSFIRGGTMTYTYTVTNNGNMTAYDIPMHIFIKTTSTKGISRIVLNGFENPSILSYLELDTIPDQYKQELIDAYNEMDDDHYFNRAFYTNSVTNDTTLIRAANFFIDLAPYETLCIEIQITAKDSVEVFVEIPDSVPVINSESISNTTKGFMGFTGNEWLCMGEAFTCFVGNVATVTALGAAIAYTGTGAAGLAVTVATITAVVGCVSTSLNAIFSSWGNGIYKWVPSMTYALYTCLMGRIHMGDLKKIPAMVHSIISNPSAWWNASETVSDFMCTKRVFEDQNCIACRNGNCKKGGMSEPRVPVDPNDITGYIAESGSHAIAEEQLQVPYMIEFENDTTFATASANTVIVRDTLDGNVFDLESFSATSFTIGENVTTVDGGQTFFQTVDMRPNIDVLAQVALNYAIDSTFSVATWTFTSIDPMTLEPTNDPTLGFLPANYNGDGIGEVNFTINRKTTLTDSATIDNRAYIVFDNEDPIVTPTWRNVVDNTAPISRVDSVVYNGGTATVTMHATDNLSGVWRYNVYGQIGESWLQLATNIAADTAAVVEAMPEQYDSFRTTAIDSAGNVEPLRAAPPTIYDTLNITSCDQYTWYASTYTESGEYIRRALSPIPGENDTVTTLKLTINSSTSGDTTASACNSFTWYDTVLTASTSTQTHTGINAAGCDSVVTLYLTVNHDEATTETVTDCDSIEWNGQIYATSGVYTFDTVSAAGCDSVVTLNLTLNHSTVDTQTVTAADSYEWNGREIAASGVYRDTLQTAAGCDSVIVLNLTLLQGIEQAELEQVNVYPNPTRGKVYISVDGVRKVEVYDVNGRHIRTFRETQTVDLSRYPVGIYTLRIETDKGKYACRVTRQ